MFSFIKNNKGQGLLEMVVAIGVITTGLFGVWNLFISNYNGEQEAGARILAINLAREGIEVVRNMRDSNWLHIENNELCNYPDFISDPCFWDNGLNGDGVGIIENMFSNSVYINYDPSSINDPSTKLYTDPLTGFYSHDSSGDYTRYRRIIEMRNICCDSDDEESCKNSNFSEPQEELCSEGKIKIGIDVSSIVSWKIGGKDRQITVKSRIFNWK